VNWAKDEQAKLESSRTSSENNAKRDDLFDIFASFIKVRKDEQILSYMRHGRQ
jgi:hypothetical protein